ncbi:hypothetical protein C8J57DRAFT_1723781 [Mycena rebaudengoi]|nr:hypothetical protein C8J57DRAFT_1723781 [Mycena rebaudengoi]
MSKHFCLCSSVVLRPILHITLLQPAQLPFASKERDDAYTQLESEGDGTDGKEVLQRFVDAENCDSWSQDMSRRYLDDGQLRLSFLIYIYPIRRPIDVVRRSFIHRRSFVRSLVHSPLAFLIIPSPSVNKRLIAAGHAPEGLYSIMDSPYLDKIPRLTSKRTSSFLPLLPLVCLSSSFLFFFFASSFFDFSTTALLPTLTFRFRVPPSLISSPRPGLFAVCLSCVPIRTRRRSALPRTHASPSLLTGPFFPPFPSPIVRSPHPQLMHLLPILHAAHSVAAEGHPHWCVGVLTAGVHVAAVDDELAREEAGGAADGEADVEEAGRKGRSTFRGSWRRGARECWGTWIWCGAVRAGMRMRMWAGRGVRDDDVLRLDLVTSVPRVEGGRTGRGCARRTSTREAHPTVQDEPLCSSPARRGAAVRGGARLVAEYSVRALRGLFSMRGTFVIRRMASSRRCGHCEFSAMDWRDIENYVYIVDVSLSHGATPIMTPCPDKRKVCRCRQ